MKLKKFSAAALAALTVTMMSAAPVLAADDIEVNEDISVSGDYDWKRFANDHITLNVYNNGLYISDGSDESINVLSAFEELTGIKVNYTTYDSNESLYAKLKSGGVSYDVIFPSDYMVGKMAKEGMLSELNMDNIPNFAGIGETYLDRSFDPGNKYSVPYMWGTTGLIYNTTMVEEPPTKWADMLLALAGATYAWFTSNRAVSTSQATARSGEENLELQISSQGGSAFRSEETASLTQVNQTDSGYLMPVSTSNLRDFVYSPFTTDDMASVFQDVENEEYYYHGRIYLRAYAEGLDSESRVNLYFDESDGVLGEDVDGNLLNAARLGLKFDGSSSSVVILKLSQNQNDQSEQVYNTVINGQTLGANQVLSGPSTSLSVVSDPSVLISDYEVKFENAGISIPDKPLLTMEVNRIYPVDIYFYLEGCDPDCSDAGISFDQADLHLAFYGILSQEGSK